MFLVTYGVLKSDIQQISVTKADMGYVAVCTPKKTNCVFGIRSGSTNRSRCPLTYQRPVLKRRSIEILAKLSILAAHL